MISLNNLKKAGEIAYKALKKAKKEIKPGKKVLDLCEEVESLIYEEGGSPAFPVNIGINHVAAHYTAKYEDEKEIGEKDVVKIDLGVEIEGDIVDCAMTIDLSGENTKLLESSFEALKSAEELLNDKKQVAIEEISETIYKKIIETGFKPIKNLTGHKIEKYKLHAGISIPNVPKRDPRKVEENWLFALEPFSTNGRGFVTNGAETLIFLRKENARIRSKEGRKIYELAKKYRLPFAQRWIEKEVGRKLDYYFFELVKNNALEHFPVLVERKDALVGQFEKTFFIKDGKVYSFPERLPW